MPNVKGLDPAPILATSLNQGEWTVYGPHAMVALDGTTITLVNLKRDLLVELRMQDVKPVAAAVLKNIDGDTITAVNALLKPYGKVKQYWRTGEYRWHSADGYVSPVKGTPVPGKAPAAAPAIPAAPVATPVAAPVAVMAGTAVVHQATIIETVKRWQDRGGKQPVIKLDVTKTFSAVGDVMIPTADVRTLESMGRQRVAGEPAFGLITGPAGTAKTKLAQEWAFTHDLPVVIVEGQSIQTASDWYGSLVPNTVPGGAPFVWEWSDMAKLLMTGQPCAIVVDELNRPENERALNGLMGLLDWKAIAKPVGAPSAVVLKPGQCIIATLNEGPEYVGTVEVDAAVRDRIGGNGVRLDYPPEGIEVRILVTQAKIEREIAKRLVRVAAQQRLKRDDDTLYPSHNVLSTRVLVDVAKGIVIGGLEPKEALRGAVKARFWPEDEPALTSLIEAQFGSDPEPVEDLPDDDDIEQMMVAHGI